MLSNTKTNPRGLVLDQIKALKIVTWGCVYKDGTEMVVVQEEIGLETEPRVH